MRKMGAMETMYFLLILATFCQSQQQVLADDDDSVEDDCKFAQTLTAEPDIKQLGYIHKNYPSDVCIYWKIVASKSEVVEVQVPDVRSSLDVTCKQGYLKLIDDDDELRADYSIWTDNSKILTNGSDLKIYFRSGHCLKNFTLNYRSVPKRGLKNNARYSKDDEDDGDSDHDHGDRIKTGKIGSIVGVVVGLVLAALLVGLMIFLVRRCVKQNKLRNRTVGDESVTVHIWSKPSGYIQPTVISTPSSSVAQDGFHSQPGVSSKKLNSSGESDNDVFTHSRLLPPPGSVAPPVPPPYSGHDTSHWRQPPTAATSELTHLTEEPPPSYTDAVYKK